MTNSRARVVRLLGLAALALAATCGAQAQKPPIAEQIAKTYGVDSWGQVEAIRYTWHAQFPGVDVARAWTWEPKTGMVTFEGKDKSGKPVKVTYNSNQLGSQPDNVKNEVEPS